MTEALNDPIERALSALTEAREPARLWERALEAEQPGESAAIAARYPLKRLVRARVGGPKLLTILGAIAALIAIVGVMIPSLGKARASARGMAVSAPESSAAAMKVSDMEGSARVGRESAPSQAQWDPNFRGTLIDDSSAPVTEASKVATVAAARAVIRKATLELVAEDVTTTFAKASLLLSEAQGEYVQDSSINAGSSGPASRAQLTLRVASSRLSAVLNRLRELGRVSAEQCSGEDVTTQMVDVEARLRNEQRVESELLQLLEKRHDAPLKEIFEVRQALGDVRLRIEQFAAQRERLSRLVDLATVLVVIRSPDAPIVVHSESFLARLGHGFERSLLWGVQTLADTLAGLLGIAIAGLPWILLLGVIGAIAVRARRRAIARGHL